jgi:hypothetical protein
MSIAAPASAGHSTGSWRYYSPYPYYGVPVPDDGDGGYYGYGYYRAYPPAYGYDDGYGYGEHYWRRRYLRDPNNNR